MQPPVAGGSEGQKGTKILEEGGSQVCKGMHTHGLGGVGSECTGVVAVSSAKVGERQRFQLRPADLSPAVTAGGSRWLCDAGAWPRLAGGNSHRATRDEAEPPASCSCPQRWKPTVETPWKPMASSSGEQHWRGRLKPPFKYAATWSPMGSAQSCPHRQKGGGLWAHHPSSPREVSGAGEALTYPPVWGEEARAWLA